MANPGSCVNLAKTNNTSLLFKAAHKFRMKKGTLNFSQIMETHYKPHTKSGKLINQRHLFSLIAHCTIK